MKETRRPHTISNPHALRWLGLFAFSLLMVGGLNACEPGNAQTPFPTQGIAPTPSPVSPTPMHTATPSFQAEITLTEAQHQQTISVQVGKVINVHGFSGSWMVSYSPEFLELMTAPEFIHQPGPEGWYFRALAPGETVILLESIPPSCPSEPCMPNIQRFEFPIQVVP